MIERTLLIVKPDGVFRSLIGKIIAAAEDAGLKVVGLKIIKADEAIISKHYEADDAWMISVGTKTIATYKERGLKTDSTPLEWGRRIRGFLLKYLTAGPIVAVVLEGNDAIAIGRKLAGATESRKADPGTIRGRFASDSYDNADSQKRALFNLVHFSDERKNADREIAVWFKKNELVDYKRTDEAWLF